MINIALAQVPNQSLAIRLDNMLFNLVIKETGNIMSMNITRNNILLLSGQRLLGNAPIIPYEYLQNGNLFFLTMNADYPFYTNFGVSQFLIFASNTELLAA